MRGLVADRRPPRVAVGVTDAADVVPGDLPTADLLAALDGRPAPGGRARSGRAGWLARPARREGGDLACFADRRSTSWQVGPLDLPRPGRAAADRSRRRPPDRARRHGDPGRARASRRASS